MTSYAVLRLLMRLQHFVCHESELEAAGRSVSLVLQNRMWLQGQNSAPPSKAPVPHLRLHGPGSPLSVPRHLRSELRTAGHHSRTHPSADPAAALPIALDPATASPARSSYSEDTGVRP